MRICLLTLVLLLTIVSTCKRDGELSETLAWMDNTYNPHPGVSGAFGHGRTGWYANSSGQAGESLQLESTETFKHDGCWIILHVEDSPFAELRRDVYGSDSYTFNLRDINPQSIKISTFSHIGELSNAG